VSEGANVAQVLHCYAENAAPVVFENFDQAKFFELSEGCPPGVGAIGFAVSDWGGSFFTQGDAMDVDFLRFATDAGSVQVEGEFDGAGGSSF
jgi:hypothetical protein